MPNTTKGMLRSILPYALFLALVIVFLWKPIFTGQALLPGDHLAQMHPWKSVIKSADPPPQWNPLQWDAIAQFYPWRVFYAKWMGQGIIPLWNPHQFCGTPFLANGQSAVLYPLNLVFLLFDPITAFTVYAALHLFLAAAFTYLHLRELGCGELGGIVGGITFAFCAFMVRWLELPTFVGAAVWLPLSLFLIHRSVERRSVFYGMLSGLAIALAFLAGHLQIAFYVLLASMLWWAWKLGQVWRSNGRLTTFFRVVVPCAGCLAVLALIASAQLLPSIELARNSHRAGGPTAEGYEWFIGNSLKAYHLVTAFIPDFYGSPATNNFVLLGRLDNTRHVASAADYMEYGMYAGILPLILALIGLGSIRKPNVGFFALLSGLAFLCALGTPINWPLYHMVPGFSAMGGPNRILLLYLFGIAGLAGFGVDWLARHASDAAVWRGRRISVGHKAQYAAAAIVLMAALCDFLSRPFLARITGAPEPPGPFMLTAGRFVAFLLCAVFLVIARSGDRISRGTFAGVAVALIAADLFAAGINYNPTCDRAKVYPRTELTDKLQKIARNERIAPINPTWSLFQTPDAILPPNSAMVYGLYDVQGYDSLYTRAYKDLSSKVQRQDSSPAENGNMVLVRRNGLQMWATYHLLPTETGLVMGRDDRGTVDRVPGADGVSIYRWDRGFASAFAVAWIESTDGSATARWLGPNDAAVGVEWPVNHVSLSMLHYPGWLARYSGGGRLRLHEDPYSLSVDTPALRGHRTILFCYQPLSFRLGLFLMLSGIAALSCVGTFRVVRRRHAKR